MSSAKKEELIQKIAEMQTFFVGVQSPELESELSALLQELPNGVIERLAVIFVGFNALKLAEQRWLRASDGKK